MIFLLFAMSLQCTEHNLQETHCYGLEKITIPKDINEWSSQYLFEKTKLVSNPTELNEIFTQIVHNNLTIFTQKKFNCSMNEVKYRWFKTYMCTTLTDFANKKCNDTKKTMCLDRKEEFIKTLRIAAEHPKNKCPTKSKNETNNFDVAVEKDGCLEVSEKLEYCGYPSEKTGCMHKCEKGKFVETPSSCPNQEFIESFSQDTSSNMYLWIGIGVAALIFVILLLIFSCFKKNKKTPKRMSSMVSRPITEAKSMTEGRRVVISYVPKMEDELEIHSGDKVQIWEEYEDGYAFGESNGKQGVFPLMCLSNYRETMVTPNLQKYTVYSLKSDK